MCIAIFGFKYFAGASGGLGLFFQICIEGITYFVALWMLWDKMLAYFINCIKGKIKKQRGTL